MLIIEKKKQLFIVHTMSPVNGKVLQTSRPVSQKVSVWTNIHATMNEYGGHYAEVEDRSVTPFKKYAVTDKKRKEVESWS